MFLKVEYVRKRELLPRPDLGVVDPYANQSIGIWERQWTQHSRRVQREYGTRRRGTQSNTHDCSEAQPPRPTRGSCGLLDFGANAATETGDVPTGSGCRVRVAVVVGPRKPTHALCDSRGEEIRRRAQVETASSHDHAPLTNSVRESVSVQIEHV